MTKYFSMGRLKQAIQHLQAFDSKWVLVPLVFAVNGLNERTPINPNAGTKPGTDKFLDKHFNGHLIGLPDKHSGNSIRPRFSDVRYKGTDYIVHQSVKLWGTHYSSRGYREMSNDVDRIGSGTVTQYKLKPSFWAKWQTELSNTFHFEELLVWLYAFSGIEDDINSWDELFVGFQERYLGQGNRFEPGYTSRFNVNNNIPWPTDFTTSRPADDEYQRALLLSKYVAPGESRPFNEVSTEFSEALFNSGIRFGDKHKEIVDKFLY